MICSALPLVIKRPTPTGTPTKPPGTSPPSLCSHLTTAPKRWSNPTPSCAPIGRHDRRNAAAGGREQPHLHRRLWPARRTDARGPAQRNHPHLQPRLSLRRQSERGGAGNPPARRHDGRVPLLCRRLHVRPLQPRRARPDPRQPGRHAGSLPGESPEPKLCADRRQCDPRARRRLVRRRRDRAVPCSFCA